MAFRGCQQGGQEDVFEFFDGQAVEIFIGEVKLETAFEIEQTALELRLSQRVYCLGYLFKRPSWCHDIFL
ncbi:MAG: hypothetical protein DRP65_10570 [Planctomycetota bacterium]|nr:MAG: hypothetical protein DRP65_10570 [Planctomycetota bacterium]